MVFFSFTGFFRKLFSRAVIRSKKNQVFVPGHDFTQPAEKPLLPPARFTPQQAA